MDLIKYTKCIMDDRVKNTVTIFGENVRYYRLLAKLTQKQLADKINRAEETISNIERKKSLAKIDVLKDLSIALGITIDELFVEEKNSQIPKENVKLTRDILANLRHQNKNFLFTILEHIKNLNKIIKG